MVGFGEAISLFYRNYANFEGRATRAEYWWTQLYQLLVFLGVLVVFILLAGNDIYDSAGDPPAAIWGLVIAGVLFLIVNFLPNLSIQVRRFHDLGQTGWLVLVFIIVGLFIPGAGIAQWIWFAFKGTDGPNQYGADPFGYDADIFG